MKTPKRKQGWGKLRDHNKSYPVLDAVKIVKQGATAKFDEAVDVAINLGIDAKKSDQTVRGSVVPFSMPAAFLISTVAGGVLMMKVKLLSAYAVISTGSTRPGSIFCVCALNALQNSMMFRPR